MAQRCTQCNKSFISRIYLEKHCATHHVTVKATPFLKWVGGKTQILSEVLAKFPERIDTYYEPFLGGGSVLFGLLSRTCKPAHIIASDINEALIYSYINIRDHCEEVIQALTILKEELETASARAFESVNRKPETKQDALEAAETYYYYIRQQYNQLADYKTVQATAYFIFLNKTCFRGVYREGPRGFNVPFGHYKNPKIFDVGELRSIAAAIHNVSFVCRSWDDTLQLVERDSFIYLDPPYAPETATSFVGYTADGFSGEDHTRLFESCKKLRDKNVQFVMSNSDVPAVRDAFADGFEISTIDCRRSINSKKPDARTMEVLVCS